MGLHNFIFMYISTCINAKLLALVNKPEFDCRKMHFSDIQCLDFASSAGSFAILCITGLFTLQVNFNTLGRINYKQTHKIMFVAHVPTKTWRFYAFSGHFLRHFVYLISVYAVNFIIRVSIDSSTKKAFTYPRNVCI